MNDCPMSPRVVYMPDVNHQGANIDRSLMKAAGLGTVDEKMLFLLALRCHAEVLAYMEIISLEEFSQNRLAAAIPGILECLKRNCPLAPSTCPDPCMRCVVFRLQVAGVPVASC